MLQVCWTVPCTLLHNRFSWGSRADTTCNAFPCNLSWNNKDHISEGNFSAMAKGLKAFLKSVYGIFTERRQQSTSSRILIAFIAFSALPAELSPQPSGANTPSFTSPSTTRPRRSSFSNCFEAGIPKWAAISHKPAAQVCVRDYPQNHFGHTSFYRIWLISKHTKISFQEI